MIHPDTFQPWFVVTRGLRFHRQRRRLGGSQPGMILTDALDKNEWVPSIEPGKPMGRPENVIPV